MINRIKVFLALACLALPALASAAQQIELTGSTMGTYYSIKYVEQSGIPPVKTIRSEVDKRLEQVNEQMSTYRPDSELSRFNSSREVNQPFPVSVELAYVVKHAIEINWFADGGLDITVGPLVNLWGFGPEREPGEVPSESEIAQRRAQVGMDKFALDGNRLIKRVPELYIDLSAIAKGYGVDAVSEYLQLSGIDNYMVDIGGEIRTKGKNGNDQYWRIAIEKPADSLDRQAYEIIQLQNESIATSGSYRNYFQAKGKRYSHTIDPKTGYPINHSIVSISVIHPSCMYADGLATAFDVLGLEKSLALANRFAIPVMIIEDSSVGLVNHYSDAFKAVIKRTDH